jgi:ABC-type uncharacterized transport system involved in gliding motility auxiliary subunit
MNRKLLGIGGLIVLLALFFGVNILASQALRPVRLDLTSDKLFTLTKGSGNIARSLDEPVTLTFFFSEKAARGIPGIEAYGKRVREVLEEYRRISNGKIILEVLDPIAFSEAEDRANAAGMNGQRAPGGNLYLGLLGTNTIGGTEIIPFFDPSQERFLEYQISRMLYVLANPQKKKVGLLSSLQINGGFQIDPRTQQPRQTPAWVVMQELGSPFEIKPIAPDAAVIPADIDMLMVVHPKELSDATLYALDQYILRGGRVLAFVDPLAEIDRPAQMRSQMDLLTHNRTSSLKRIFDTWGIEVVEGQVVADPKLAIRVVADQRNPEPITYLPWLNIRSDVDRGAIAEADPAAGSLRTINVGSAGIIRVKPAAPPQPPADNKDGEKKAETPAPAPTPSVTITPIIQSSDQAAMLESSKISFQPDPRTILNDFKPGTQRLTIAARLTGTVKTAFPEGKPASDTPPPADAPKPEHLTESKSPINVVLIADVDILADQFWVQQDTLFGQIPITQKIADNGDFVMNLCDNLVGSTDLLSVRARGVATRPFTRVEEMTRDAEKTYLAEQKRLEAEIEKTSQEIQAMEQKKPDGSSDGLILSPEQEKALKELRQKVLDTRKELRRVQLNLNKDVEELGTRLKLLNIGAMPAAVGIFAIGLGAFRLSRRKRKVQD